MFCAQLSSSGLLHSNGHLSELGLRTCPDRRSVQQIQQSHILIDDDLGEIEHVAKHCTNRYWVYLGY